MTPPLSSLLGTATSLHCKCWSLVCPSVELSLGRLNIHILLFVVSPGGYETFNSQYPECCVNGKLISPERMEAERNLASHCEKQSANHKPAYDQVCVTAVVGEPPLGTSPCSHQALWEAGRVSWPWCCCGLSLSCHSPG